ncbi:TPA: Tfp pilus assembly protein FimT/FimU [Vibrio vulnificus]
MARGFTLLEMLIVIVVMGVIATIAAPSPNTIIDKNRVLRVTSDLQHFLMNAKSEAVMRNTDLWVHFAKSSDDKWELSLRDNNTAVGYGNGQSGAIAYLDGNNYPSVKVSASSSTIRFEGINGKPLESEHIKVNRDSDMLTKVMTHVGAGRIRVCEEVGRGYGYPNCPQT